MTEEEERARRNAYARGYAAGRRGAWPEHRPPQPPNEVIAKLMAAARKLRDAVDGELAALLPDDEWQRTLGEPVDAVDEALTAVSDWLKND